MWSRTRWTPRGRATTPIWVAYAYGNQADTDYVQVEVTDMAGNRLLFEVWNGIVEEAPEPEVV